MTTIISNKSKTDVYNGAIKEWIYAIVIAIISTLFFIGILFLNGHANPTSYTTTAIVYNIEDNEITLVDGAGYEWILTDRPDLKVNDFVEVKFNDNRTDYTREDDIIMYVRLLDN